MFSHTKMITEYVTEKYIFVLPTYNIQMFIFSDYIFNYILITLLFMKVYMFHITFSYYTVRYTNDIVINENRVECLAKRVIEYFVHDSISKNEIFL